MMHKGQLARKNFGKIEKIIDLPHLIEMQRQSYERFLQKNVPPEQREDIGLQGVFKSVFPIRDFTGNSALEFVSYRFGEVKYDEEECLQRGMTYEASLKMTVRLVVYDLDKDTGAQSIRDIKEQEIYFGTIPLMTNNGTFIINGTERVVVSQLHRSPGIFFDHDQGKTHSSGKLLYSARVIPLRGSWIDLEFDPKDILYVRIDRRRKFPVTLLLKALGYSTSDLLETFYPCDRIRVEGGNLFQEVKLQTLIGSKCIEEITDPETHEVIIQKDKKFTRGIVKRMESSGINYIPTLFSEIENRHLYHDVVHPDTGKVLVQANEKLTKEKFTLLMESGVREFNFIYIDEETQNTTVLDSLALDKVEDRDEAIMELYRKLRPSNPPTPEIAFKFFNSLFFDLEHYDLSSVGRMKLNQRLEITDVDINHRTLRPEDLILAIKKLIELKTAEGLPDDIDHLGNRRVRAVGELLETQYRVGLVRMQRAIKERMSLGEIETLMPHDLINPKPVSAVVKEFFGTSQLSQFMDQTNPLSEVTHKRRLSALGPGGLTRERAGFEVRDVHPSHYGRICPIETPEGPNIGLIVSLSTYARVNDFGFIETPYRVVRDGRVSNEVTFLTALDEKDYPIAQANAPIDKEGRFLRDLISCRIKGEFVMVPPDRVKFMDVSPNQLVSVAAALIPFLENDDANRALMGSNMQRQAVPLLNCEAPLVGTGMESSVAKDSGVTVTAKGHGIVEDVDASRIVIRYEDRDGGNGGADSNVEIRKLIKYQRSNQNTCFNQKPLVRKGDRVEPGQIIADGPATSMGELALGRNVTVGFMSWGGYDFEDSILVSERLVKDERFTSIHIEEFEILARDTKLGKEEITRDIPNVGEEALKNLDESGIIRIGAEVKAGDILVGKVTPKGETQLSPEEKLLRAIFGEKAGDVKDSSLRVPPGVEGIVLDARVFSRRGVDKDDRAKSIEDDEVSRLRKDQADEIEIITKSTRSKLEVPLVGRKVSNTIFDRSGHELVAEGEEITRGIMEKFPLAVWGDVQLEGDEEETVRDQVRRLVNQYSDQKELVNVVFEEKVGKLRKGDELPPGVIKMIKVYVSIKRKLSVGDKMAGRHGNKGVVSRILPEEDMPFFEDGTPVDIVLNPLGVPSRMNVGQILETHLGWGCAGLGKQIREMVEAIQKASPVRRRLQRIFGKKDYERYFKGMSDEELISACEQLGHGVYVATPVFDSAEEDELDEFLRAAGLPVRGQALLYDGRTGELFDQPVTVGVMYMMKLHHLVDDKIHARSIGPYSLVTQQPLGGKAQFGGQRLGEMEVWALEAYGAAYSLQEFLTVKSDDVAGRTRMYEKIVKGDNVLEPGLPESFNVLVKELKSLGMDVELFEEKEE
jgi:DNA-directed RNA polymerase subunit beta